MKMKNKMKTFLIKYEKFYIHDSQGNLFSKKIQLDCELKAHNENEAKIEFYEKYLYCDILNIKQI